jgi:hypothetical protein
MPSMLPLFCKGGMGGFRRPLYDDTYRRAGKKGFHLLTLPYMYKPQVQRTPIDHYWEALR